MNVNAGKCSGILPHCSLETFGSRNGDQIWLSVAESFLENVVCGGLRGERVPSERKVSVTGYFEPFPPYDETRLFDGNLPILPLNILILQKCHVILTQHLGWWTCLPSLMTTKSELCVIYLPENSERKFFGTLCKDKHVPFEISILVQIYFHGIFV